VAIGIVLNVVTGVSRELCILFSASVVMIYTLLGGMWSISITDFFHNLIIILALAVLAVLLWNEAGGWDTIYRQTPTGFFRFLPRATAKDWVVYLAAWMTIGLGSIPQQDVFQRVMAAKSENTSVRASYLASVLYLTVAMLPLFIALSARILHPALPKDNQLLIPNMVMQHGSLPLQVLFFGAVTSAILSVSSGAILAPAAVFGENVVKFFRPDLSDQALLKTMRWAVVVITGCSVWMSTVRSTNIFDLVGESSAFSLVSLFVPLTAGIYWKRANLTGCLWSMSGGFITWLLCLWIDTDYPALVWGLLASAIAMILGSLLKSAGHIKAAE
jgi:Na+/proline symporter